MSQSAGTAYVDIVARLDALESGLSQAKAASVKSGEEAGKGFGAEWGKKFTEQAKGIVGQLAGPMIAAQLAKATASVLRSDKALPDAILDAIKTIPFVGAFAELGSAIYDATYGAADKAAEDLIAQQSRAMDARMAFASERQKEEKAAQAAAASLIYERRRLEIETETNLVREAGDKEAIIRAEYAANIAKQDLELQQRLAQGINDVELNALLKLNQAKRLAWEEEGNARLMNVWKEADEKAQADQERKDKEDAALAEKARKESEAIQSRATAAEDAVKVARLERDEAAKSVNADAKTAKEAAEAKERGLRAIERERALRESQSDAERKAIEERFALEEESAAIRARASTAQEAAVRSMGSASTALGSFVFDPYPASEQKRVQMEIASNTKRMAESMASGGFQ